MTYLFDTSAWLAHLFGEPGVAEIGTIFDDPQARVSISVLSLPEMYGRLKALNRQEEWASVREIYAALFSRTLDVDEPIAQAAIVLRAGTTPRLPTVDALIAATAVVHKLTLVHRDPHIAAILDERLRQMKLPDR